MLLWFNIVPENFMKEHCWWISFQMENMYLTLLVSRGIHIMPKYHAGFIAFFMPTTFSAPLCCVVFRLNSNFYMLHLLNACLEFELKIIYMPFSLGKALSCGFIIVCCSERWKKLWELCQKLGKIFTGPMNKLLLNFKIISDVYRSVIPDKTTFTMYCLTRWISFKALQELWNPLSQAVSGKFHGSGGHSKCSW